MKKAILTIKEHPDFEGLKWVIKAVAKETNSATDRIEVKAHVVTATDAKRLHEYILNAPEDFPDGLYWPYKVGAKTIILILDESGEDYPEIEKVFPTDEPIKRFSGIRGGKTPVFDQAYSQIIQSTNPESIQIDFVRDMLSLGSFDVSIFGNEKPVLFLGQNRRGLIMPLRTE